MCLALIIVRPLSLLHPFPDCCSTSSLSLFLHPVLFINHFHEVDLLLLFYLSLFLPDSIFFHPLDILFLLSKSLFLPLLLHFQLYFLSYSVHVQGFLQILLCLLGSRLRLLIRVLIIRVTKLFENYVICIFYKDKSFMRIQLRLGGIIINCISHLGIWMVYLSQFSKCIFRLLGCAITVKLQ